METLAREIRFAFRALRKSPTYFAVAVSTLALGIGANTAIFSAVHAVLFRPVSAPNLDRLYVIREDLPGLSLRKTPQGPKGVEDIAKRTDLFEAAGASTTSDLTLTGFGEPQRVVAASTIGDIFSVFSAQPALGRFYRPEESEGGGLVTVISYGMWQRVFGRDPGVVNRTIELSGKTYRIAGVLPQSFDYRRTVDVWVPLPSNSPYRNRNSLIMTTVVRVRPGISEEQLADRLRAEANTWHERYKYSATLRHTILETPLVQFIAGELRPVLLVLMGAVVCVLLIACANVSSLELVRATGRAKEMAVRIAVGAGRWPLIRQLLAESLLLAIIGGIGGILIGYGVLALLSRMSLASMPALQRITLNGPALLFTAAMSLGAGLLFGLSPAMRASRLDLNDALKDTGRGSSGGVRRHRLLESFAVAQVALALVLLAGSGLLIQSLGRLMSANLGFRPDHLVSMQVSLPSARYGPRAAVVNFFDSVEQRLAAIPAIQSIGLTGDLPFSNSRNSSTFNIVGRPVPAGTPERHADMRMVNAGFFRTMGIPLLKGRVFEPADHYDAPMVVVIDAQLARQYFGDEDPIGKQIMQGPTATVVGVVGGISHAEAGEPSKATIYWSCRQFPRSATFIVVRTALDPVAVTQLLRPAIAQIDPNVPLYDVRTMNQRVDDSLGARKLAMLVMSAFAGLSLVLSLLGVYGVASYTMSQRIHEIGVRMALGARGADIIRMVLRRGLRLAAGGVGAGVLAALILARFLASLLYGVSPRDPLTLTASALLLVVVSLAACLIPAHRAGRVDPVEALRHE